MRRILTSVERVAIWHDAQAPLPAGPNPWAGSEAPSTGPGGAQFSPGMNLDTSHTESTQGVGLQPGYLQPSAMSMQNSAPVQQQITGPQTGGQSIDFTHPGAGPAINQPGPGNPFGAGGQPGVQGETWGEGGGQIPSAGAMISEMTRPRTSRIDDQLSYALAGLTHLSHPPLSAKDSCQTCWAASAERGGGPKCYSELMHENHGDELAEHFHHDRYLQQQREHTPTKLRGPGRYRDRAAGYADEHPEEFRSEHLKPGENPFADRPHFERHVIAPEHADPGDEGDVYWGEKKYHSVARRI